MAVNFTKNQDDITKAWRDITNSTTVPKWALFGYEGSTNNIKLMSTGSNGLDGLVEELNCSLIQYAFCRVIERKLGINKLILINWQGDSAPLSRKGLCASHVGDVTSYFKGCTQTITIRNDDEATKDYLMEHIIKTSGSKISLSKHDQQNIISSVDRTASVQAESIAPKKDLVSEISENRKSFWQRQEEEEKERLADERRKAAAKKAQFEAERKMREDTEAQKLAEKVKERDRLIEATRQAENKARQGAVSNLAMVEVNEEDDGRVGRRSELIRLERNQETQSLISKGSIKNRRAIFEQTAKHGQQQQQPTLSRRSSGSMVAQRMNAFNSSDVQVNNESPSPSSSVDKVGNLQNRFAKQANLQDADANGTCKSLSSNADSPHLNQDVRNVVKTPVVCKKMEPIKLTPEADTSSSNELIKQQPPKENLNDTRSPDAEQPCTVQTSDDKTDVDGQDSFDVNGNNEDTFEKASSVEEEVAPSSTDDFVNGKHEINAIALYDYQAADHTEISFDPNDMIVSITKVDPGWWHGTVLSGKFKGQVGLFPSNYVKEL